MLNLPVIDLSKGVTPESRKVLSKTLFHALTTTGFFYLEGVEGFKEEEVFKFTKWFFNLPLSHRMACTTKYHSPEANQIYRGYFPTVEGMESHKEGFEIGPEWKYGDLPPFIEAEVMYEKNAWPTDPVDVKPYADEFKRIMHRYYDILTKAGIDLLALVEEAYGLKNHELTELFRPSPVSTFRLLHYPPRIIPLKDSNLQCCEHKDSSILTLLCTCGFDGLEILMDKSMVKEGEWEFEGETKWVPVPIRKGAMVVNIGALLEEISGGVLKATMHRVVDIGGDRYSVPFFLEPSLEANVSIRLPLPRPQRYGKWVIKSTSKFVEYKDTFREFLRIYKEEEAAME